jgi:hypothetical protein
MKNKFLLLLLFNIYITNTAESFPHDPSDDDLVVHDPNTSENDPDDQNYHYTDLEIYPAYGDFLVGGYDSNDPDENYFTTQKFEPDYGDFAEYESEPPKNENNLNNKSLAEKEGFEPSVYLHIQRFSRPSR